MSTLHQVLLLLAALIVMALLWWRLERRGKAKQMERAFAGRTLLSTPALTKQRRGKRGMGILPMTFHGRPARRTSCTPAGGDARATWKAERIPPEQDFFRG
jgi:Flp pilus assembly protein TadB